MTPDEHYAEAERLAAAVEEQMQTVTDSLQKLRIDELTVSLQIGAITAGLAQVHATLATAPVVQAFPADDPVVRNPDGSPIQDDGYGPGGWTAEALAQPIPRRDDDYGQGAGE